MIVILGNRPKLNITIDDEPNNSADAECFPIHIHQLIQLIGNSMRATREIKSISRCFRCVCSFLNKYVAVTFSILSVVKYHIVCMYNNIPITREPDWMAATLLPNPPISKISYLN